MSDDAIDMKEVLERVQDDRELLIELLQIFSEDYAQKKKRLDDAIIKNDFEQVRDIAHGFKGASGNISAKKLRISFTDLGQMAKDRDFSKAKEKLDLIDAQFNELQDFVEKNLKK